ncbi:MAG: dihydroorotate dehydrogenase-like protein [Pirellulaceae bacterium]|jgi:dihydroorotate dehydrogenase (fumarate)|nr:dihydroorotate dehydrogenase-like protein [Pirellulaceae bacterium]
MAVDLTTTYLGLSLRNPLVVAACPLTGVRESLRELEACGAAAAVLPSLFAEQIEHEETQVAGLYDQASESFGEATTYFPELSQWHTGPEPYLQYIADCKRECAIPIIASLNGSDEGSWLRYARLMETAGADALELNVYFVPTDPHDDAELIEQRYVDLVAAVRRTISIPLAVKIGPFVTSLPHLAARLAAAGAQGLVLFNRYLEPDIDTEALQIAPNLVLSDRHELRLSLRWIATLRHQVDVSLAATSGVHFAEDVLKALLAGADVAMVAAALLRYGPCWLSSMLSEMTRWLENRDYIGVSQLRGSMSMRNYADPSAYHRANYTKALTSYTRDLI